MTAPAGHPQSGEPSPPPGPGVFPPFGAPPTDRDDRRMWLGIGAGVTAVVVCCVAAVAGLAVLVVGGAHQVEREAQRTVSGYLGELKAGKTSAAYHRLCERARREESALAFARRVGAYPVTDFRVGEVEMSQSDVTVAAEVEYTTRGWVDREFVVQTEGDHMVICGER